MDFFCTMFLELYRRNTPKKYKDNVQKCRIGYQISGSKFLTLILTVTQSILQILSLPEGHWVLKQRTAKHFRRIQEIKFWISIHVEKSDYSTISQKDYQSAEV